MDGHDSCPSATEIKALMDIWARARIRAFAHGFAARRLRKHSQRRFGREVGLTLTSLGLLICGYFATQLQFIQDTDGQLIKDIIGNVLFLSSILISLLATYVMLTSGRGEITAIQSRHKMMVRSFLQIAQKVRRMESHVYDPLYYKYLISFLNDQIEGLVTAGESPSDDDYEQAHQRFTQVKKHRVIAVRHTFVPGTEEEEAIASLPIDTKVPDSGPSEAGGARRNRLTKFLGQLFKGRFVRKV